MKTSHIKLILIEVVLVVLVLLNIFFSIITNVFLVNIILALFCGLIIFLLGFEKERGRYKTDMIMSVVIVTFIFQIIYFVSGLIFGYLKSGYSLEFVDIIMNILPLLITIFVCEVFRYSINRKGDNSVIVLILSVVLFTLIDIMLQIIIIGNISKVNLFDLVGNVIFFSVSKNILLTYMTTKIGYSPAIVFRLIMELPIYILPIIPNINEYFDTVIMFIFPFIVLYIFNKTYTKIKKEVVVSRKKYKFASYIMILLIIFIVFFTSGVFRFYALSIGSGSMEPNIDTGDIVIVDKGISIDSIKEGDVLVYNKFNKVVVHRVIEVVDNGKDIIFYTKGDNNDEDDNYVVVEDEVIGKTLFRVRFLGYPTLWFNEILT